MFPVMGSASVRAKYYIPPIGTTIISDPDFETRVQRASKHVERSWNDKLSPWSQHPLFGRLGKEGAARMIAFVREQREYGEATVVTPEIHRHFLARARARTVGRGNNPSDGAFLDFPVDVERRIDRMRSALWEKAGIVADKVTKVAVSAAATLLAFEFQAPIV